MPTSGEKVTGTASGVSQSGTYRPNQDAAFNVSVRGTWTGSVNLERSFDEGSTWFICSADGAGTPCTYTSNFSIIVDNPVGGTVFRLNFTALSAGTAPYEIG